MAASCLLNALSRCLVLGCSLLCYNQAIDIRRVDPGSGVNIIWHLEAPAVPVDGDVINITTSNSDVTFSCSLDSKQCDVHPKLGFVVVHSSQNDTFMENDASNRTQYNNNTDVSSTSGNNSDIIAIGLELRSVSGKDAGVYTLTMSLKDNITEYKVAIYVYQKVNKPTILGQLGTRRIGEMLSFTCSDSKIQSVPAEYRNMSNLKYSWYRNNILIANVTKQLTIDSLSKLDNQAQYRCAVREDNSSFTEVDSETVTLDVAYTDSVKIQTSRIGLSEVINCTSDCYPECSHRWLDDGGRVLSDTSRLEPSKETSGSRITCEASNEYGSELGSTFLLYTERRITVPIIVVSCMIAIFGSILFACLIYLCRLRRRPTGTFVHGENYDKASSESQDISGDVFNKYRYHQQMGSADGCTPLGVYVSPTATATASTARRDVTPNVEARTVNASVTDDGLLRPGSVDSVAARERRRKVVTLDIDLDHVQTSL